MSNDRQTQHFSDAELLAYLDGAQEPDIAQQIEQSPAARQRLAQLSRQQKQLAARLYRAACPDPHTLGEYHLNMLAAAERGHIRQHVDACPHCARELQQFGADLQAVSSDIEVTMFERLRLLVARLIPPAPSFGTVPGPVPALAGMRGGNGGPLTYEAGAVQVAIEIHDDAATVGRKSIVGLVTATEEGAAQDSATEPGGWQVTLWREEGPVAELLQTVRIDDLGNFMFDGLAPGDYALTLRGDAVEIVIQELAVS